MTRRASTVLVTVVCFGSGAQAGGVERSILPVGVLFEPGNYAELSFGGALPDVSGVETVGPHPLLVLDGEEAGDMAVGYGNFGLAYKHQLTDAVAVALFYDQPYGADVGYPDGTGYYAAGSTAELDTHALTGVVRYEFANNLSLYGGLRYQRMSAEADLPYVPGGYNVEGEWNGAWGYLVGVAYERPEIALRVGLTYASEITHELDTTENFALLPTLFESETEIVTPQSVTLDFQTGIAEDTLLFGSIRWVEWTEFVIAPERYAAGVGPLPGLGALVDFEDDRWTYSLGLGRRLNETWSIAGTVGYEPSTGSVAGNLGPTDGFTSVGFGVTYTHANVRVTTGLSYVWLGDAETPQDSEFDDNTAVGAAIRIGYTF